MLIFWKIFQKNPSAAVASAESQNPHAGDHPALLPDRLFSDFPQAVLTAILEDSGRGSNMAKSAPP
jgi:hypothetical protein